MKQEILPPKDNGIDPRLNSAQKQLGIMLMKYRHDFPFITEGAVKDLQKMVDDFVQTCRRKGIDVEKQRVVAFTNMNHIAVWPQELPHEEIQKRLRMLVIQRTRHSLPIDAEDIAKGVRRAYPYYSPSRGPNILTPATIHGNKPH